jgi:hypothetical protein
MWGRNRLPKPDALGCVHVRDLGRGSGLNIIATIDKPKNFLDCIALDDPGLSEPVDQIPLVST